MLFFLKNIFFLVFFWSYIYEKFGKFFPMNFTIKKWISYEKKAGNSGISSETAGPGISSETARIQLDGFRES